MVAVPGRSKGCTTCRRRKIRCDLREPQCGQCIKSGRQCEGYGRQIAFIHRTPQGLLRKGQELCRGSGSGDVRSRREATSTLMSQMPPQVNNAAIYVHGILDTFLVAFLPSSSILSPINQYDSTEPPASWLQIAIALPRRGDLLSAALQALCMTKIGRVHDNKALLMQGMAAHGRALRALQNAMHNTNTAVADETLAAMRVLGMYEMFEGTMGSFIGWTFHEEGVERLMQLRGFSSSQHESELGKALFAGARRSAMIRGLQFHKSTFFGEERWCVEPWGDNTKDYIQQLNDIGLLLPAILEDLHTLQSLPEEQTWQRCQQLENRFDAWHAHLLTLFPVLPYWEQPAELTARAVDIPPIPFETTFNFLNIRVAEGLAVFWTLRILLHAILRGLSGALGAAPEEHDTVIIACACNIARSVPYFTLPNTGYLGTQLIFFPLKAALSTFLKKGRENESQWSREVLVAVQNRGIRFGGDIVDTQWGEPIR